ncbi:MAG: hypothetical protein HY298_02205 [Verrucomicrobia bacterium]|nr:hypothetical protein [Verrucomicrobiota bacterium]
MRILFVTLLGVSALTTSQAAVINWTNTGNGNWSVSANWNPNQVPSTNDTAVITHAGTYTVTLNLNPTIAGLVVGGESGTQTLNMAEQTLTLNGSGTVGTHGVFTFLNSNSTLIGTNHITLGGILNWGGGTINTNAAVTIATGGQMKIASGANFAKYLYGCLTNHGTITWQLYGGLRIGGVLHNAGLFDAKADLALYRTGNGVIINDGVFRKSAGTGTLDCQVPLINNGTVDTQTGQLTLADGSVFNSGCAFIGAGGTRLDSGTNTISGSVHSENLSLLYGATLTGTGSLSGTLTWGGGNIGPDAAITVATNGNLLIASAANYVKNVYGRLTNAGTITWQPHSGLFIGGVLHNLPGALFDAQLDGTISQGGGGLIINEGVFRKSVGAGTVSCGVPVINSGTVDTQLGTVVLSDGSTFNAGSAFTGSGTTRLDSGTNSINGAIYSENLALLYDATLTGVGSFSGTLTWGGGNIGPDAAITVATNGNLLIASAANYVKNVYGRLTNAGTITWQPHSGLLIGGVLHNLPGALFDAQFDGPIYLSGVGAIVNDGTFQKSAGAGSVTCDAPFINNGSVKVSSGTLDFEGAYTNPVGTVLLAGGTFRTIVPLWLSGGLLTGWGTVSNDVTNGACIRPSPSNGVLTINGKCEQLLGGRMEFELAGNLPGTNQSRLNITGAATLRGTVGVRWGEGYVPSPGTNFPVLTFASRQGEFCCFDNFLLLGQGRRLTPIYNATSLTFATVAAPEPTEVPLRVAVDSGALVCWPVEFPGYDLYWNTNLSVTNWTLLPGVTNRYLELPPLAREKFFWLSKP